MLIFYISHHFILFIRDVFGAEEIYMSMCNEELIQHAEIWIDNLKIMLAYAKDKYKP